MLLSLFAAAVVNGLVPVVNAEALLLAAVIAAPPALTLLIVTVVVVGQVVAKIVLYQCALGLADSKKARSSDRARVLVERFTARPAIGSRSPRGCSRRRRGDERRFVWPSRPETNRLGSSRSILLMPAPIMSRADSMPRSCA